MWPKRRRCLKVISSHIKSYLDFLFPCNLLCHFRQTWQVRTMDHSGKEQNIHTKYKQPSLKRWYLQNCDGKFHHCCDLKDIDRKTWMFLKCLERIAGQSKSIMKEVYHVHFADITNVKYLLTAFAIYYGQMTAIFKVKF